MRIIKAGATDQSVVLRIVDSADGTPETGVVWNTSGIDLWYRREGAAKVSITEATLAALTTAHSDGGFLHIGDGYYRLDLPDAAVAAGATHVTVGGTVTGMVVIGLDVQLVAVDLQDAVRGGMTALPNAAADAAGGLPISDAGGLDLDARLDAAVSSRLAPTTAGRTLDITIGGAAGVDWGNVENPTTTVGLSGTTVKTATDVETDTQNIQTRLPAALVGGRMDSYVGAMVDGLLTAAKFAAGAFDAVWSVTARLLTAGTNIVLAKGTGVTGFNDLSAAQVNAEADQALADAGVTGTRMGYLDKLNISGNVASSAEVVAIQNNTRVRVIVPPMMERPDSGSVTYRLWLYVYDEQGAMEAPDSTPVIAAENQAGTDRSSALSAVTNPSTGVYYADYTCDVGDAIEALRFQWTVVEGGVTRYHAAMAMVVDTTAVDFTAADRVKLNALHDDRLTASRAANLDTITEARLAELDSANLPADVAAAKAVADAIQERTDNLPDAPADDATVAKEATVAALNNLSSAQAQAAAAAALAAYDGPTRAEATSDKDAVIAAIPSATANADALLDRTDGIETGWNLRKVLRLLSSVLLGKVSGAGTSTNTFRDLNDTKDRVAATVDTDGNRTAVTKDGD